MKNKFAIPRALFDKSSELDQLPYPCIKNCLNQLAIDNIDQEYKLSLVFLKSYVGSNDTFTAYRREIEKLLQWVWLIKKKSLKTIDRADIQEYLEFMQSPPESWISTKTLKRFQINKLGEITHNDEWRPFVTNLKKSQYKEGNIAYKHNFALSKKSIQSTFAVLSTYFVFLMQEQYLEKNPVGLIRQKSRYIQKQQQLKVTRKLSNLQWDTVIDIIEKLAQEDSQYFRIYFMLSCFFLLGLRISELAETSRRIPTMGDFAPDQNGLWWFTTVGKGNKMREVAVPDQLLEILKKYRKSRGLSLLPSREEQEPLIHQLKTNKGLGIRQIRNLVQYAFDQAINKLKTTNKLDEALDLENATVHWLRHTSISRDINIRPREHIRDDVGHENPATMDKYIDIDKKARHESAKTKTLKH